jgi:hypothetical protein
MAFPKGNKFSLLGKKGNKGKHPNPFLTKLNKSRKGVPRSDEIKEKISKTKLNKPNLAVRGEKNRHWKGGVTPANFIIRGSLEYKLWRRSVFERDSHTCVWCGDNKGGNLHADHIKPFAFYPELRFAIDNGRTLCVECHKKTDTFLWKAKKHKNN